MNENRKLLGAQRYVTTHELNDRAAQALQTLSTVIRRMEAELIGELARKAHEAGTKFAGWPTVRLVNDDYRFAGANDMRLHAEVWCVPA